MKIVVLTDLLGQKQWVINAWVQSVRIPLLNEYPPNAMSVLVMSGYSIAVQEFPEVVVDRLKE